MKTKSIGLNNLWARIANFFEYGDLTPLAVVISVAHYGPVLMAKSDSMFVAWLVGATIDLIHFRTVRRLFQVKGRRTIFGHALIAAVTTMMATGYHLRFYDYDWLLALPIPIGIGILAQHAAARVHHSYTNGWRNRLKRVITIARKEQKKATEFEASYGRQQGLINKLQADATSMQGQIKSMQETIKEQQTIIKAWNSLNSEYQALARLNSDQITPEQAAAIIGVKDTRTVQSRAEKVNGVHK